LFKYLHIWVYDGGAGEGIAAAGEKTTGGAGGHAGDKKDIITSKSEEEG
jgi:hypothetical protein